jgi:hypothetical protein
MALDWVILMSPINCSKKINFVNKTENSFNHFLKSREKKLLIGPLFKLYKQVFCSTAQEGTKVKSTKSNFKGRNCPRNFFLPF